MSAGPQLSGSLALAVSYCAVFQEDAVALQMKVFIRNGPPSLELIWLPWSDLQTNSIVGTGGRLDAS